MSLIIFDEIDWTRLNENFSVFGKTMNEWAQKMMEAFNVWFPRVSEAQREEAKRVHSMYRRKQKARRRRNRRR